MSRNLRLCCGVILIFVLGFVFLFKNTANYRQTKRQIREETKYKKTLLAQDIEGTFRLSCTHLATAGRRFLEKEVQTRKLKLKECNQFLKSHPEIVYLFYKNENYEVKATKINAHLLKQITPKLAIAQKFTPNFAYCSNLFSIKDQNYFIMSEQINKSSLILGIDARIINKIATSQRKNLRLVPYPIKKVKIKTVLPNTEQEIKVRTGEDNGHTSHYHKHEIVVKFKKLLTNKQILNLSRKLNLTFLRQTPSCKTYVFRSQTLTMEQLRHYFVKHWNIFFAEPHYLYLPNKGAGSPSAIIPNDALYAKYQWNLPQTKTELGWNVSKGSFRNIVAVLDTGVQLNHPDLKNRLIRGINLVSPGHSPNDEVGHGTHVTGIIAAKVNNNKGIAGMTWHSKVMPIKVLDPDGAGSTYAVAEGIIWAADHGAKVINLSLGNYAKAQFLHDAIRYASHRGVILVAASGNDNTNRLSYPAAYPEVIAVSAVDQAGKRASFSNFGNYIELAAPGTAIPSTYLNNQYATLSGTSMATPHVAALIVLMCSANPKLTKEQIRQLLHETCDDSGPKGKDIYVGYGKINVKKSLEAATKAHKSWQLRIKEKLQMVLCKLKIVILSKKIERPY